SSGWVYSLEESTSVLSTPSSSPPVIPNSISRVIPNLLILSKYCLEISIFSSSGSSDKSIMWEEKSGLPFCSKYFSLASSSPSIQGNSFLAQWSVCKITVAPYNSANSCTCLAPVIEPAIAACWLSLLKPFPAIKQPPPFEN